MSREQWAEYAKSSGGELKVWVEQGADPGLRAANSEGVCFALAANWVYACIESLAERLKFLSPFFNMPGKAAGIPQEYLDDQDDYMEYYNKTMNFVTALEETSGQDFSALRAQAYGPSCISVDEQVLSDGKTIPDKLIRSIVNWKDNYFMYSMSKKTGENSFSGHVVGLGNRTWGVPSRFEFFDANLGYFVFKDFDSFFKNGFFLKFLAYYRKSSFTHYELANFFTTH